MKRNAVLALRLLLPFILNIPFSLSAQMAMDDCDAHPGDDVMHTEHCAVMALVPVDQATHISINNGSWFNPSTWNTGTIPVTGSRVLIDSGTTVTYDGISMANLEWLRVNGTLQFATNISTQIRVTTTVIAPGGTCIIGTEATPVQNNVTMQWIFPDLGALDYSMDPYRFGKGYISHGSTKIYGANKKSICATNKSLNAGATKIKLAEVPFGWKVGDQIVLPGTNANNMGNFTDNTMFQDEVLTITAIGGKNILFTNNATGSNSLQFAHKIPAGYGLRMYIANITRNIQFYSEHYTSIPTTQRAHLMLMHNVDQSILYAAFDGMGRTNKDLLVTDPVVDSLGNYISGGENPRGRYSVHVHRAGKDDITATPLLIKGCSVSYATGWGIVNHEGNVDAEDNVVFDFGGAAFVTEDGEELGFFIHNMAIKGRKATTVTDFPLRTSVADFGFEGNGFWLQSSNLTVQNNIAVSCGGDAYKVFSDDAELPEIYREKIPVANILNPEIAGGLDSIYTAVVPLRSFSGNIAYNCDGALAFWTHMLNADNVGDFSTFKYNPYTHTLMSVVENCSFWNLLSTGISIKYSAQITLKNSLLLGDEAHQFQTSTWITGNPVGGFGILTSTVTGQIVYDHMTVKGWKHGIVVARTDDLWAADDVEYNYRTSKLIGGTYGNNIYNMYPEEGADAYGAVEYYQFPKYFEISGAPAFSIMGANMPPVADYAFVDNGGKTVQFNATLAFDPDPVMNNAGAGNGIASYVWNFGDGNSGFGMDPVHYYTAAGTYPVTLTVYDCQGSTSTSTKNVTVADLPYHNVFAATGFESGAFIDVSSTNSTKAYVNNGWMRKTNWLMENGKAMIYNSDKWNRPLVQVVQNDKTMRGIIPFSFQAENLGIGASGNDLICEIYGINGEFQDPSVQLSDNLNRWNNNDLSFTADLLLNENFGLAAYNWQTFYRNVNMGSGYDYIMIKFYSQGVKTGPAEEQGIDNVCFPCTCTTPGHVFEQNLTSDHVTLIWDNVGSEQYQVQYKTTTGGSWTTLTLDNTYADISGLAAATSYTWKVRALCDATWTAYSADKIFITPNTGTLCTSPHVLQTNLITGTQATATWDAIPGAALYKIAYKKLTAATWTEITTTETQFPLTGLLPLTAYQWKVRTQCVDGWKDYSGVVDFITLGLKEDNAETASGLQTQVSPNPAGDLLQVAYSAISESPVQCTILDMLGRTLMQEVSSGNTNMLQLDLHSIPVGVYVLHIQQDGIQESVKFIRQ